MKRQLAAGMYKLANISVRVSQLGFPEPFRIQSIHSEDISPNGKA